MSPGRGGCLSRVVASIHLFTVDAGLLLGCCRADAVLLLSGCRISPWAACELLLRLLLETCCQAGGKLLRKLKGFPKLFSGLVRASFLASFGTRNLRPTCGLCSNVPAGEFDALFEEKHNLATEVGCRNIELRCKSEPNRFVTKTYMNQAFTWCLEIDHFVNNSP